MQETKRCSKCGETKPLVEFTKNRKHKDGLGSYCLPCNRAHMQAWREANREKMLATLAAWQAKNPEKRNQYNRTWRGRNPEVARGYDKKWYDANTEKALAKNVRWIRTNPDKARENARRHYAAREGAPKIKFTPEQLAQRMAYYGNRCWICRGPFEAVDHVKPITKGGWHCLANLRPVCRACNSRKRNKWPFTVESILRGVAPR